MANKFKYLTTEEIVLMHDEIIKETGGYAGLISRGNLDFIVSQMQIPQDIARKATTLLFGILSSHPFLDGNKRTAIASVEIFLKRNNKRLEAANQELWDVVHKVSEGKLKFEEVVNWIKDRIRD